MPCSREFYSPLEIPLETVYNIQYMFNKPGLIREEVYSHLKNAILEGDFVTGEKLAELELVERLGVSRTPIREAMQRLTQEGLLESVANKSVRVRKIGVQEARETYAVREILDALAAKTAALMSNTQDLERLVLALERLENAGDQPFKTQTKLDLAFHREIAKASHNAVLLEHLTALEYKVALIKQRTQTYNAAPETASQHRAILEAILARDADRAAQAAALHVRTFAPLVIAELLEGGGIRG